MEGEVHCVDETTERKEKTKKQNVNQIKWVQTDLTFYGRSAASTLAVDECI